MNKNKVLNFRRKIEDKSLEYVELLDLDVSNLDELAVYLEENYGDKYPMFVDIFEEKYGVCCNHCFELVANKQELERHMDADSIVKFYNSKGEPFIYAYRKLGLSEWFYYMNKSKEYIARLKQQIS